MPFLAPVPPMPEDRPALDHLIPAGYEHYFDRNPERRYFTRRAFDFSGEPAMMPLVHAFLDTCAATQDDDYRYVFDLLGSELATNAIKHTRSGDPGGHYTLKVERSVRGLTLTCRDSGTRAAGGPRPVTDLDADAPSPGDAPPPESTTPAPAPRPDARPDARPGARPGALHDATSAPRPGTSRDAAPADRPSALRNAEDGTPEGATDAVSAPPEDAARPTAEDPTPDPPLDAPLRPADPALDTPAAGTPRALLGAGLRPAPDPTERRYLTAAAFGDRLTADSGRGLALVDSLATAWGDNGHPTFRKVWFYLAFDMSNSSWPAA